MTRRNRSAAHSIVYPIDAFFPKEGRELIGGTGRQFIDNLGEEAAKKVVASVLLGENLRQNTEFLTRRRLSLISAAIISMFIKGNVESEEFKNDPSTLALNQLGISSSSDKARLWPAQWLLGLTGKSVQNVLRSESKAFGSYINGFNEAIIESAEHAKEQFGNLEMSLIQNQKDSSEVHKVVFDWEGILRITTAIGAQTLAIRGSDKSLYGKLFEKLVLGTALTILGFEKVERGDNSKSDMVFWLSDSSDNREADATARISLGKVARFDIGFIGSGNPEISKDKLSRFGNEIALNGGTAASTTFVVVDRLPATSKTLKAAQDANAIIIQMSMSYWLRELAEGLSDVYEITPEILSLNENEIESYVIEKIKSIDVSQFASNFIVSDTVDDSLFKESNP